MTLREVTCTVLKLVEDASGCPVLVNEDRSLTTLAASRIARGANRIHSISFNPSAVSESHYLICYQCGFISLRVGQRRLQPEGGESAEGSAFAGATGLGNFNRRERKVLKVDRGLTGENVWNSKKICLCALCVLCGGKMKN
jgi:hypothetical protein